MPEIVMIFGFIFLYLFYSWSEHDRYNKSVVLKRYCPPSPPNPTLSEVEENLFCWLDKGEIPQYTKEMWSEMMRGNDIFLSTKTHPVPNWRKDWLERQIEAQYKFSYVGNFYRQDISNRLLEFYYHLERLI